MERQSRFAAGIFVLFAMIFLTGCTTEEQAKYNLEKNSYFEAQRAMGQALERTPKEKKLQDAAEKLNREAEKLRRYHKTMKAAIKAIKKDDAEALDKLQMSEEGKELARLAEEEGSCLYLPDGGTSGTGIGLYVFDDCDCRQWYYGDYKDEKREGSGIWYYVSSHTENGKLYKEVYDGQWSKDKPNGIGHQFIALGGKVDTEQKFKVKNGLFYGTYKIKETLEDGTVVTGTYKLKKGKYVTISDEELTANNFEVPDKPHLPIAFLYNEAGVVKSCKMVYAEDVTRGVKHFYPRE